MTYAETKAREFYPNHPDGQRCAVIEALISEVIEDCAQVVDCIDPECRLNLDTCDGRDAATRIRALASPTPTTRVTYLGRQPECQSHEEGMVHRPCWSTTTVTCRKCGAVFAIINETSQAIHFATGLCKDCIQLARPTP